MTEPAAPSPDIDDTGITDDEHSIGTVVGDQPDNLDVMPGEEPVEADLTGEVITEPDIEVDVADVDVDDIDPGIDESDDEVLLVEADDVKAAWLGAGRVATPAETTTMLRALGFRIRSTAERAQAIRTFQRGWSLGVALLADGIVGPKTTAALRLSYARLKAGKATASANFSFRDFACKCQGRYSTCRRVVVLRVLIRALEAYRRRVGKAVQVVSGYRCPSHNKAVGGASVSQHMFGAAADVAYALSDREVASLRVFSGIGRSATTRMVRHVDCRHAGGRNTTGASVGRPTTWDYAH